MEKIQIREMNADTGLEINRWICRFAGGILLPKSMCNKATEKAKETKNLLEQHKKDMMDLDKLEQGSNSIFGSDAPKIEIPKNIQGNLNKNRPNFAINSYDPLILDLNNDGKINLINSQTYFDYEGDGIKEAGYWLDKFNNRKIA